MSKEVMKQMTINFAKPMEACKQELNVPDAVMQDFFNFWKEGYQITNREAGCVILCLAKKLELLDQDMNLHHGKAMEFAMKHGADEAMAKQLLDIAHSCEKVITIVADDPCQTMLNLAMCFKAEIHKLDWAPTLDVAVGELLADT
uniref:Odorant binding protein OBP5 n=1 Tax=Ips acuminatus TaxID=55980 RepID=A0A1B3B6G0_9CUCU|nr:odorant binding protein OBP5 [Ips acuminatus]